jgi:UDP-N-acetylglucosamine 2-epimerase (non-hydrolysing)
MKISVVLGTRPEIVKMASIIKHLESGNYDYDIIHTQQHYDSNMSQTFFDELELPLPDYELSIGSGTQAEQTANAMCRLEETYLRATPDLVLVQGDTNTVLAGALTAEKMGIKVGHVEAGLRSNDRRMPEEYNRRIADHISDLLFAPTQFNAAALQKENVWGQISITGNTVIDACIEYLPIAEKKVDILSKVSSNEYALVTAHRAENVDNEKVLKNLVKIFINSPVPVIFPVHPRTVKRLKENGLFDRLVAHENVMLIDPVGYFEFLVLMKHCSFILTDSGGIQEEASAPNIRKKVFVLRDNTERPESVESGYAEVVGTDPDGILDRISRYVVAPDRLTNPCPYGGGRAGIKILQECERIR